MLGGTAGMLTAHEFPREPACVLAENEKGRDRDRAPCPFPKPYFFAGGGGTWNVVIA
jgi:hypothetical protein